MLSLHQHHLVQRLVDGFVTVQVADGQVEVPARNRAVQRKLHGRAAFRPLAGLLQRLQLAQNKIPGHAHHWQQPHILLSLGVIDAVGIVGHHHRVQPLEIRVLIRLTIPT